MAAGGAGGERSRTAGRAPIAVPAARAAHEATPADGLREFEWTSSVSGDVLRSGGEDALAEEAKLRAFFSEHGFVVVRDALTPERTRATVDEVWENSTLLGSNPDIDREDPSTWGDEEWPVIDNNRGFLDAGNKAMLTEAWKNMQDPTVLNAFSAVLGVRELWGSVDRFGVLRPAGLDPRWRTDESWPHWDQHPWTEPGFRRVQGLIALTDNTPGRGGFMCVPGFHKRFDAWAAEHEESKTGATLQRRGMLARRGPTLVPEGDPIFDELRIVTLRAGSLLLWDSRLPHQNYPNDSTDAFRIVQYQRYTSAKDATRDEAMRIQERARDVAKTSVPFGGSFASHNSDGDETDEDGSAPGFPHLLTPIGRRVVGLDLWPCHEDAGPSTAEEEPKAADS